MLYCILFSVTGYIGCILCIQHMLVCDEYKHTITFIFKGLTTKMAHTVTQITYLGGAVEELERDSHRGGKELGKGRWVIHWHISCKFGLIQKFSSYKPLSYEFRNHLFFRLSTFLRFGVFVFLRVLPYSRIKRQLKVWHQQEEFAEMPLGNEWWHLWSSFIV